MHHEDPTPQQIISQIRTAHRVGDEAALWEGVWALLTDALHSVRLAEDNLGLPDSIHTARPSALLEDYLVNQYGDDAWEEG